MLSVGETTTTNNNRRAKPQNSIVLNMAFLEHDSYYAARSLSSLCVDSNIISKRAKSNFIFFGKNSFMSF